MKEGIRMMEANNWPELTSVMRPQREAGHWARGKRSQRLGGAQRAQRGQSGHGAGAERVQRSERLGWP